MSGSAHEVRSTFLDIGGHETRVLSAGHGPAVVFVHGLGLGADFWRYHLERIADAGYHAIAPDMPGFGESKGPAFAFTVEHAAEWLHALAAALGIQRATWVGHSVSSQYVLRLAVTHPDRVAGLVLAAPTGEPGALRWLAQLIGLARTSVRERPRFVGHVLASYFTTPPTRVVGAWLGARRHHALDDAPAVAQPMRIVLGGRDPVVPRPFAERLASLAARGELVVVAGSAHGVALAPAEPFCRVLVEFLDQTFPPASVDDPSAGGGKAVETA